MILRTHILQVLAEQFAACQAGRTGAGAHCPTFALKKLLEIAACEEGDARELAEADLKDAERIGILERVPFHKRDPGHIEKIRVPIEKEAALFAAAGLTAPTPQRAALAAQFTAATRADVPPRWRMLWQAWCERQRTAALAGGIIAYFDRQDPAANQILLDLLPKLLSWQGESLVRFASCVLCNDSKTLESLATKDKDGEFRDKLRGKLGRLLADITGGLIHTLDDLGILPNPRSALIHGPLKLKLAGEWLDVAGCTGRFAWHNRIFERAEAVVTTARRCLTVENETSFHELAKLRSGELLVQTSYPGSGTLALLKRLPGELEFWHFGDSDEAGFDILRVLREKSGRDFQPLQMRRGRVPFEQEALGRPELSRWPFYGNRPV